MCRNEFVDFYNVFRCNHLYWATRVWCIIVVCTKMFKFCEQVSDSRFFWYRIWIRSVEPNFRFNSVFPQPKAMFYLSTKYSFSHCDEKSSAYQKVCVITHITCFLLFENVATCGCFLVDCPDSNICYFVSWHTYSMRASPASSLKNVVSIFQLDSHTLKTNNIKYVVFVSQLEVIPAPWKFYSF